MNNYELLDTWEDSIENFLNWIKIFCGVDEESLTYSAIKENVETMKDLSLWIDYFRGDLDEIEITTELFLEAKRSAA